MKKLKLPHCTKPCKNCPFKKDTMKGWLGEERMKGILNQNSFVCHKTTQDENIETLQCAGFMLIKENESEFVRTAKRFNISLNLKGKELVFESKEACINHHSFDE